MRASPASALADERPRARGAAWPTARRETRTSASPCSCTAIRSPRTCGATSCRPSPRRAGGRSRPTCPATATPSRTPRHLGAAHRGARALRRRARARPGRARHPRLGSADRTALGLRSPRRGARPRDLRRRVLRRPALARPGERDAHPGRGRAADRGYTREGFGAAMRAVSDRDDATRRSTSTGRGSPTTCAVSGTSSYTARATSRSSSRTRAASPRSAFPR